MPDVQLLNRGQSLQPVDLVTGKIAAPMRVLAVSPQVEADPLEGGSTAYLELPEFTVDRGSPMAYRISTGDGGSTLTGMGGPIAVASAEYTILGALIVIILTAGALTISAEDETAPEGSRFAAAVTISAGFAQAFICSEVAGVKKWFPLQFATPP